MKPFSYAELLARIKALLRRKQVYTCGNMKENGQNVDKKGDLKINTTGNKVFSGDEEIYLTETEYEILSVMLKYRGKIFPYKTYMRASGRSRFSIILQIPLWFIFGN